jgi:hypothetical protein
MFTTAWLLLASPAAAAEGLWSQIQSIRADGSYADASAAQRLETRRFFSDLVAWASTGTIPSELDARAHAVGLVLVHQGDVVVVIPTDPAQRADGVYAVRVGVEVPDLVLQAPHAWSDVHTGQIVAAMFEEGLVRAAFFNSAHRHAPSSGDIAPVHGESGSDLAHRPFSIFQAATLGVIDGLDEPLLIQVHGFGSGHGTFGAVVSKGAAWQPSLEISWAAELLEPILAPYGPIADGEIVPELAGTTNAQGRAAAMDARFLHLELSLAARAALTEDPQLRTRLQLALSTLAEPAQ